MTKKVIATARLIYCYESALRREPAVGLSATQTRAMSCQCQKVLALLHRLAKLRNLAQDGGASPSTAATNEGFRKHRQGIDETQNPAMMVGSLHGKLLRQSEVRQRQPPLHEGLTRMKSLLIWPARFAENLRVDTKQRQPPEIEVL
ncbi:hypothetical protein, partial [Xanthomonas cucurbitae]|uniref:hypothetical protein n=1 Tax=Xanthomonas cucurbitae TaxID=56453 RepID=UPI003EBD4499